MLSRSAVEDACAYFDTWLAFRVRCDRIPGIQAAVLHDGDVVWTGAHGLADVAAGTALTPAHRFRIASHSKTFTATAVVRLADEGALRLDDTVGRWVPEVAAGPIGRVTLRELLGHGGGVARDGADADFWCLGFPFPDRGDLLGFAADPAAGVLARNERFKYSNVGFSLLGAVVEAATGSSYADHVTDVLLRPLGLDATTPDIDPAAAGDHATGYTGLGTLAERLPIDHVATGAMAAATGFSSTATDVVRWFGAHCFGDDRILSDDAKRLMQHTQWSVAGAGEYALGLDVADLGGRRVLGHGGGFPGFITQTWFDPVDRLAVAVFTNVIDGPAYVSASLGVRLVGLAADGGDGIGATGTAAGDARAAVHDLASYTGRFSTIWGTFDIAALGGRLVGIGPALADPLPGLQRFGVVDADTLRIDEGSGYGAPGELVRFERDAEGAVVSVRAGGGLRALPEDVFRAAMSGRSRVELGGTG